MLDDILEDSWTYQEIVKKGREKAVQTVEEAKRAIMDASAQETEESSE